MRWGAKERREGEREKEQSGPFLFPLKEVERCLTKKNAV